MRFTVLTPTYNRADLLQTLYDSLRRQSFKDFEWVVVDDGSTDNTEEVVSAFADNDNFFPIAYIKTPNGGKHRAWNRGVEAASGELIFGCDSDDYLTDDALEITDRIVQSIPKDKKDYFAGVCGLKAYKDSELVGETFEGTEYMDMTHLERIRNNVSGDKSEVIYTEIWKKYKYHEFAGENFLTEATALNRMAADGLKMRYFNSVVKIIEYLQDGLSSDAIKRFASNPKGWGLYLSQQIEHRQLKGMKKCYKLWEYYDCCIKKMSEEEIAHNLNMSKIAMKGCVLAERINKKLKR